MERLSGDAGNVAAMGKVIDWMTEAVGERESVIVLALRRGRTADESERDRARVRNSSDTGMDKTDQNKSGEEQSLHVAVIVS